MSYQTLAERLKNLKPGESLEVGGLQPTRPTSEPPKAVFDYGMATRNHGVEPQPTIEQRVAPLNFKPEGLPQRLEGNDDFQGQKYPAPAQPLSDVGQHPTAFTQPKRPQPNGSGN